ncbi:hypothetical protein P7K49_032534 [Saguinus oedipus]|uniref:Homeobox KN domain-containing protein n=1 Tax=Saguinus oedipus TaxID=9490 RepID=A0ABQ9TYH9_SAGOE|nr:hypothetical protein P7K49_032534 [Saguinus oedipus]
MDSEPPRPRGLRAGSLLQLQLNQDLSILHQDDGSSKNKRGVLPKHATNVMRSWLFQHIGVRTAVPAPASQPSAALAFWLMFMEKGYFSGL